MIAERINKNFIRCGGYLFLTTFDHNNKFNGKDKIYAAYPLVNPEDQDMFDIDESLHSDVSVITSMEGEVESYLNYCLKNNKFPVQSKTLYLMVGLPCSGKTTWLKSDEDYEGVETLNMPFNLFEKPLSSESINHEIPNYVSADLIKESLDDYDNINAHLVHERSVSIAKKIVEMLILFNCPYIVMDGGGINNSYTKRIAENAVHNGYKVVFIIIDTPAKECAKRLETRSRKVPLDDLYHKYILMHGCISDYRDLAREHPKDYSVINVNWFTNKYLFLDLDGTVCEYVKPLRDYEGDVDFVNSDIFINPKPIQKTIDWVNDWLTKNPIENLYILGACPNSIAFERKKNWVKKVFPDFKLENFCWVGNKDYKHVFLRQFIRKNKWNPRDVTMVDDFGGVLDSMEKIGVNFIHPTGLDQIEINYNLL